jgi:hypothetical protein
MLFALDHKSKKETPVVPDDFILGLTIISGLWLYFLPTIIAVIRRSKRGATIFSVNLVFGWTVAGWIATAIWVMAERRALEEKPDTAWAVESDIWSFDPAKSIGSVEEDDHWVLGLENFAKAPQKIS